MKRLIILYLLTFVGNNGFAQPSPFDQQFVDSITTLLSSLPDDTVKVNNLVKLASMHLATNSALTIKYAKEGANIAEKINYPLGKINCLGQSAFFYAINGEWGKATIDINEAMPLCEKYRPASLIGMYNLMFINAVIKGDNDALKYPLRALHHPSFPSSSFIDKWVTYMQLGRGYVYLNQVDSAKYYANLLTDYVVKYSAIIPDLAENSNILFGDLALKAKNYPEAIKFYLLGSDYISLAKTHQVLHQRDSVIYYALKGLKRGNTATTRNNIIEASKILAQEYREFNPKEANKYLMIYSDAKDSLYNNNKLKQLEEINFNIQKTEYERQKTETANKNKLTFLSLLGILAFFSIVSILLWRNIRFKQKANLTLEKTLTELKTTQTQLIQKEKLASLGELTAGIAHEIQNPLNFVKNFSELNNELIKELKNEVVLGNINEVNAIANDIADNSEKINLHGQRASSIVKGMLEHSRKSSGEKTRTDINALCDEYIRLSYHGLRAKDKSFNAEYKLDLDPNLPKINVVSQDISRVLLNLINNAFQATDQKRKNLVGLSLIQQEDLQGLSSGDAANLADSSGAHANANPASPAGRLQDYHPEVAVSSKKLGDKIEIKVTDNGPGIPDSIKDKIFQPFFTTKPTGQGTGLGLSLSYDIVKAHGGELKVETREGEGAAFSILIPTA